MLGAFKAFTAALLAAATPLALPAAAAAPASELADAYNGGTDHSFRVGLQTRLAWTGDYRGRFAGTVDAATLRAVRDFQARHGKEASGVIDAPFLADLVAASDAARAAVGIETIDDAVTGARVSLPLALVRDAGPTPIGRVWRAGDNSVEIETVRLSGPDQTIAAVRAMLATPTLTRTISHDESDATGFTLAGTDDGRTFLMRIEGVDGDLRGFGVSYTDAAPGAVAAYAAVAVDGFDPPSGDGDDIGGTLVLNDPSVKRTLGLRAVGGRAARFAAQGLGGDAAPGAAETDSSGSGFVVSRDGWLVTNAHVVKSCRSVLVGDKGAASQVLVDETNDLALVRIDAELGRPLPIASGAPRLGEDVLALGFPLRSILADSLNVTRGNVSSLLGLQNDARYLQVSAPIQPGNSGGPLVDLTGRVVGVVTAKLDAVAIADATGDIPQSINFAIRPDAVARFLADNGINFDTAEASKDFASVADTTEGAQDSVLPILCLGGGEAMVQATE